VGGGGGGGGGGWGGGGLGVLGGLGVGWLFFFFVVFFFFGSFWGVAFFFWGLAPLGLAVRDTPRVGPDDHCACLLFVSRAFLPGPCTQSCRPGWKARAHRHPFFFPRLCRCMLIGSRRGPDSSVGFCLDSFPSHPIRPSGTNDFARICPRVVSILSKLCARCGREASPLLIPYFRWFFPLCFNLQRWVSRSATPQRSPPPPPPPPRVNLSKTLDRYSQTLKAPTPDGDFRSPTSSCAKCHCRLTPRQIN